MPKLRDTVSSVPWLTLLGATLACAIEFYQLGPTLQLDRFDWHRRCWTLLTSQWTHWSMDHLRWDLLVFMFLGGICERMHRGRFLLAVLISAVVIPSSVLLACPKISQFRGLSGIDCALLAMIIVSQLKTALRERDGAMFLLVAIGIAAFVLKTAYEFVAGSTVFVAHSAQFAVVPMAHVAGAATGVFCAVFEPRLTGRLLGLAGAVAGTSRIGTKGKCACCDSNAGPRPYQGRALTN